jgi:protein O-mannosyl-transferase
MAKVKAKAEPSLPKSKSFWTRDTVIPYLLGAFAFLLYIQTVSFGYALDDIAVLHGNNFVKNGVKGFDDILTTFYWHGNESFAGANSGLFRPLSLLLFATEWQIFGDRPGVFHFIHILLYAAVVIQLYKFLISLLGKNYEKVVLVATLLWIVLPIHTEVVANLKSADEILSLLFSLLGLRYLLKWSDTKSMISLLCAVGFFFLSLLAKEAAALVLPLALLALIQFRDKKIKDVVLPGALLFGMSLLWLGWHIWVIHSATSEPVAYDYRHNALLSSPDKMDQLGTAIGLQARYWVKMLIGYPLSWNYSFNQIPVNGFADVWPWLSLAGIIAGGYFAWKYFRSQPALSYAIIFYFVTFLLTSNIFFKIGDIFAERFTFVPSVGFCLLAAVLLLRNKEKNYRVLSSTVLSVVVVVCAGYSIRTWARTADWKDQNTLFLADVDHAPQSARVHDNAGNIYFNEAMNTADQIRKKQLLDLAYHEFVQAYEIDSLDYQASQTLGQIMYHKNDFEASLMWSRKSVESRRALKKVEPNVIDDYLTFLNIGDAFIRLRQHDSATHYYVQAVHLNPASFIDMKIGNTLLTKRDTAGAIDAYTMAASRDSFSIIEAWDKIANLKGMTRDYTGSNEAFLQLATLSPQDPKPWKMLYTNYMLMGDSVRMKEAATEYYKRGGK